MADPTDIESHRPRRRRWPLYSIAPVLCLLGILALPLALRLAAVRAAVLERAGVAIEAATGVRATAREFAVDWRRAAIELSGVEVRAGAQAPPFLTAERLRAEVRLRSLFTSHIRIRRLEIGSPVFDFGAPRPAVQTAAKGAEPGREVSIERFAVRGGKVAAPDGTLADDAWLERMLIESLDADGSMRTQELTLEIPRAAVTVTRRGAEQIKLALSARLRGPLAGPWELDALSLSGPGLGFEASGRGGFEPDQPLELDFDLTAEPGLLVPDLARREGSEALLESEGRIDWRQRPGSYGSRHASYRRRSSSRGSANRRWNVWARPTPAWTSPPTSISTPG